MRKIYSLIKKLNAWLASFGVDRYLHLIAGLLIAFFVALLMMKVGAGKCWYMCRLQSYGNGYCRHVERGG